MLQNELYNSQQLELSHLQQLIIIYFLLIYPVLYKSSADNIPPPAAPLTVLCDTDINL